MLMDKSRLRILHVDDDHAILEVSQQILMDMGNFEIDHAFCVEEAFKKLSVGKYDIIVSDYEMPQKNGLDFLTELRQHKNGIPFILFTGKGREEVAIKALNLGADGYHNKQGNPETVYGELTHSIKLIVERYKTKKTLQEQELRFTKLAAQTPGMLFQFLRRPDGTYCIPFTSNGIYTIFGCSPQDVQKNFSPIAKVIVPEDLERVIHSIEHSASNLSLWQCEYRVQLKGQKIRWLWGQSAPERLEDGSILWSGYNTDITQQKSVEEDLKGTLEVLEKVGEGVDAGLAVISRDYRVVWANKRLIDLGVTSNKKCYETHSKLGIVCPNCGVEKIFEQNVPLDVHEYKTVDFKGETVWFELRTTPLKDTNGIVTAALELVVPITERKKMEDALRQDKAMLDAITDNIGAGLGIISKDYRVLWVNKFIKNNVGAVEGKLCYSSLNTLDHICPDCGVRKVFEQGVERDSHEYSQIGVHGEPYYVELVATPLKDKDGNVTAALEFVVDLNEKKQMQQKLLANETKFKAITDSVIDAIFMFDEEDKITYWNPAAEQVFGYTEQEIIGEKIIEKLVPPRFRENYLKFIQKHVRADSKKFSSEVIEFPARKKDETEFLIEFSLAPLQMEGKQYIVAIARDITDRKKAETALDHTMDQLVLVNEKLGVVGSLTRHDVNNKLSAVIGYAYLLKKKYANQPEILEMAEKIEQAVTDSTKIFDFAKLYEQLGVEKLSYIDIEKTANEAVSLFSGFDLKVNNNCHGLSLLADSLLIELFYNLIDDTKKYGKKATTIRVYFEKTEQAELQLIYEDDGVGISAENKLKLFKEGFSTGGSTGFGLFLIRKMMDVYGWQIQETGEPGKGAKFIITIPRVNQKGKENFHITNNKT